MTSTIHLLFIMPIGYCIEKSWGWAILKAGVGIIGHSFGLIPSIHYGSPGYYIDISVSSRNMYDTIDTENAMLLQTNLQSMYLHR